MVESRRLSSELGTYEVILADAEHAIAMAPPFLVQVRRGAMTLETLALIERRVRDVRARFAPRGRRVAIAIVLEEHAPVAKDEVRARQRQVVEALIEGLDARMAAIVVGDGVSSLLQRSVARGLFFANPNIRVMKSPESAAAWLGPHIGVAATDLADVIERTRALRRA